ncbi:MAG TPA: hypothetical protein VGQ59_07115, partial [Cyclobacteriaceae bacterium]|nr:hypothetical protein [Cyclobacteriaceae bacterium]
QTTGDISALIKQGCGGNVAQVDRFSRSMTKNLNSVELQTLRTQLRNDFNSQTLQSYSKAMDAYSAEKRKSDFTKMAIEANKVKWEAIGEIAGDIIKIDPELESQTLLKATAFVGKKTLEYTTDYLKEQADEARRKSLDGLLYNIRQANSSYIDQLKQNSQIDDATFIQLVFSSNSANDEFYKNLDNSDKASFLKSMQDELRTTIMNTELDNLGRDELLAAGIQNNVNTMKKIQSGLRENINETWKTVNSLNESQTRMQDNLKSLAERQDLNTRDLDFIKDYLYGKMSAADKLRALDQGFLNRLSPGDQEKERAKLELIKAREEFIANSKEYLSDAQNVLTIANNLGIKSPLLDKAQEGVAILNTGLGAFTDFASGNYLGAIASLTGIFGKRPDPVMEKLKVMDKKLDQLLEGQQIMQEQLQQIQHGIDQILQGQQLLYNALLTVSDNIDKRLDVVYDEVRSVHLDVLTNRVRIHDYSSKKQLDLIHSFIINDGNYLNVIVDSLPDYETAVNNILIPTSSQLVNFESGLYKVFSVTRSQKKQDIESHHDIFNIPPDFKMTDFILDNDPLKDVNSQTIDALIDMDALFHRFISEKQPQNQSKYYLNLLLPFVQCSDLNQKETLEFDARQFSNNSELSEIVNFLDIDVNSNFKTKRNNNYLEPRFLVTATDDLINYYYLYSYLSPRLDILDPDEVIKGKAVYTKKVELLKNARFLIDIGIAQQLMLSGDILIPYMYNKLQSGLIFPPDSEMSEDAKTQRLCLNILAKNDIARYNFMKYYIRQRLTDLKRNLANYSIGLSLDNGDYLRQTLAVNESVEWSSQASTIHQLKLSPIRKNDGHIIWEYGLPINGGQQYSYFPLPSSTDDTDVLSLEELKTDRMAYRNALDELTKYRRYLNIQIANIDFIKALPQGDKESLNKVIVYDNIDN